MCTIVIAVKFPIAMFYEGGIYITCFPLNLVAVPNI